jgi:hypothetical protein
LSVVVVLRDALAVRSEFLRENRPGAGAAQPRITGSLGLSLLDKCLCSRRAVSKRLLGPLVIDSGKLRGRLHAEALSTPELLWDGRALALHLSEQLHLRDR